MHKVMRRRFDQTAKQIVVGQTTMEIERWSAGRHYNITAPGAQFTKHLTIYRKIIVRSTYDSDLQRAKSSLGNMVS